MDDQKPTEIDIDEVRAYILRPVWQLFRVALPAKVTTFLRDTGRLAGEFVVQFLDTTRAFRSEQPVEDVPVMFQGGDGYGLYHDLAASDPVYVVAGDAEHRAFWEDGSTVSPTTGQRHSYGCAVAFPGGRVSSSVPGQATTAPNAEGECLVGAVDGTAGLRLRRARPDAAPPELGTAVVEAAGPTASLLLGSSTAAVPAACAPQALVNLADLNARVQAWVPVPNDGGASLKPIIAAWFAALQDMADAKARFDGPAAP